MTTIADMAAALSEMMAAPDAAALDTKDPFPSEKILIDFQQRFPDLSGDEMDEILRLVGIRQCRSDVFVDFIRRGLVVINELLPDGSAAFTWTQPDHPEVVAFRAGDDTRH